MKKTAIYGYLILLSLLLLTAGAVQAQNKDRTINIAGVVVDDQDMPVAGVTVNISGTLIAAMTDNEGAFKLKAKEGDILSFTFLGFKSKNIMVTKQTTYKIKLKNESLSMDDVIVIGYGSTLREDLTGSVSGIRADELMKSGMATFAQGMQGRLAGVKVTTQSGEAGAGVDITIRGANSLNAGTSPLYVIDGMQIDINEGEIASSSVGGQNTYNPLASLNSSDIASIDILKDASATAIYGARGANGVIIITTKRGTSSMKTDITLNAYYGISQIAKGYDMLDGQGYIDYKFSRGGSDMEVWGKDYGDGNGAVPRNVIKDDIKTYNWQEEMTRIGFMQSYDISMNTIVKKTRISASLGYYDQKGVIKGNGFKRYSGRIKLDHEINPKVAVGVSTTLGRVNNMGAISSGGTSGTGGYTGIVQMMYTERPVVLYTPSETTGEFADGYVPLSSMTTSETYKHSLFDRLMANAYVRYNPIMELSLKLSGSISNTNSKLSEFYSSKSRWGNGPNGRSALQNTNTLGYTVTATADYNKTFDNAHRFSALLGAEINGYNYENMFIRVDNYENQSTGAFDISKGLTAHSYRSNVYTINRASTFARVNYDYKNRYYITANIRVDASSNFDKHARVGYFPSVALAWRVDKEPFMKSVETISNLKLRASAGITGNDRISAYSYLSNLGSTYYGNNGSLNYGQGVATPDNKKIKWETTYQYDIGVDLDMFSRRISLSTDIYLKDTRDMLYNANIPSQSGFARKWSNLGRMTNYGFEFSIKTRNIDHKKFTWSTSLNFDTNKTQLISLGGKEQYFPVSLNYGAFTDVGRVIVGEPIGLMYGYVWDGNYQISDFTWTDKATGTVVSGENINSSNISMFSYKLKDGVPAYTGIKVAPGDRKYKDMTGDNVVNPNDRTVIGDSNPKFNFGISNDFQIGDFDLSIFIEGSYGGEILNAFNRVIESGLNSSTNNISRASWENKWTAENGSNTYARLLNNLDNQVSTYFVEDGSYMRIKNINIGYTFGERYFKKIGINSIRIYAIIDNVYTFTKYSGLDPEVRSYEKFLRGMDQSAYPRTRNFMFGVNMSF